MAKAIIDSSSRLDIVCRRGDTFGLSIDFGQDMSSNGSFKMQVRKSEYDDTNDTGATGYLLEMEFDSLTESGKVLYIKKDATSMKAIPSGIYVYDLQTYTNATIPVVKTWLYGTFTVKEDITVTQ